MFGTMLFLHLTSLFVWLGAILAIVVMLVMLKKQLGSKDYNALAQRIIRVFTMFAHPSAVIVLISGVLMLLQMDMGTGDKPFWLIAMERGGGTIILLALVITSIAGSKLKKRLSISQGQEVKLTGYLTTMTSFLVLIVSIVLIVSLKI